MNILLDIVDIHARRAERKSTLIENAPPVEVTVWDIIAIYKGVDTNYQLTVSTMDPREAAKYKVGGTMEARVYPKPMGQSIEAEIIPMPAPMPPLKDGVVQIDVGEHIEVGESLD